MRARKRAVDGDAPLDNHLAFMDQASFLALRARDQAQLIQWVWVYDHGIDLDGLRRFHRNLDDGLLGRRIERSLLPFGRHRWVSSRGPVDFDMAERVRPRAELSDWADERAQVPIDPEFGPGWHLGVAPFADGSTAVTLVASHCLVDGGGCTLAIVEAVKGENRDLGYPPPHSRTRLRAVFADARQTVRGVPEVTRALAATARVARGRRQDIARLGGSRPLPAAGSDGDDRGGVIVPAITVYIDVGDWDARAKLLGGTSNSLLTGFAARLGERMGRRNADDGMIRMIITANDRLENDDRANAVAFAEMKVDPTKVTTDLSDVRADFRQAVKTLRETPDEALEMLPLTPLTPKRAVRRLGDVLFAFADLPVTCSNIGDIDPMAGRPDGSDADRVFARGVDQHVTQHMLEQKFFLGSGRIGSKIFITVVAYQLGGKNSRADLREIAAQTLAEFDLVGVLD